MKAHLGIGLLAMALLCGSDAAEAAGAKKVCLDLARQAQLMQLYQKYCVRFRDETVKMYRDYFVTNSETQQAAESTRPLICGGMADRAYLALKQPNTLVATELAIQKIGVTAYRAASARGLQSTMAGYQIERIAELARTSHKLTTLQINTLSGFVKAHATQAALDETVAACTP